MIGISTESSIDRVTRVTDRDFTNHRVNQKVDPGADKQREHTVKGLAFRKEVEACQTAGDDNRDPQGSVEILLHVKGIVATAHAIADKVFIFKGWIHSQGHRFPATRANHTVFDGCGREGNFPIALTTP